MCMAARLSNFGRSGHMPKDITAPLPLPSLEGKRVPEAVGTSDLPSTGVRRRRGHLSEFGGIA